MRSLVFSPAALAASSLPVLAALAVVLAPGCAEDPVLPEYLGILDGGPAKPAASIFPLIPGPAAPFPSGSLMTCAGTAVSAFSALTVAGGAAYGGGDLFVAAGEGVLRFSTDASGCPAAASGPAFATALAPVRAVAIIGTTLWAAGSAGVTPVDSLGVLGTSCPTSTGVGSLAVTDAGGLVGSTGGSSLAFFSQAGDGGCTTQAADLVSVDGSSGAIRGIATDGSLIWVAELVDGASQIESGKRSADGATVTIDMPLPALTDACSVDAIAISVRNGVTHVVVADDTCRKVLEYATDAGVTLVSSTPMRDGYAVRALVPVPDSPRLLAVEVAPASTGSVIVFDVITLP